MENTASSLVKKIYRTFDEKSENEPYNLKSMYTEKSKLMEKEYIDLFNLIAKKVYDYPEKSMDIAFKLLGQICKTYPELHMNAMNIEIFYKVAKF